MFAGLLDALLSPAGLLWLAASFVAATLLFGSINRRRGRLTDALRQYVDEKQPAAAAPARPNTSPPADANPVAPSPDPGSPDD